MKKDLEDQIRSHGFDLQYVDYCESAQTPGMLGYYRGLTSHINKTVKVSIKARNNDGELPTEDDIVDVLEHELKHIEDPAWICGSKPIISTKEEE